MHYRGLAKKRLFPVRVEGVVPDFSTPLHWGEEDAGEMRSHNGPHGLALLKIEIAQQALLQEKPLTHGQTKLWPFLPKWMKIDAPPTNR
jgi:folate-binding Fe-S cluster repair protein YgfZ